MELGLRVRREATVVYVDEADGASTVLRLKGRVTCSRPIDVDLFVTVTQGLEHQNVQRTVDCPGETGVGLPRLRMVGTFPSTGQAAVRVEACTNPSNTIDEDCITVERLVDVLERRPLPPMIPAPLR